jgi:DNA invertase Pin-like site-specific DNA recombinase
MAEGSFVAYYRVSTAEQGRSGLGLESQRDAVHRYLNGGGWALLGEFTEVETGKGSNALAKRPALREALALAKRHKATLIIAKMDRLSRNVHFITGLLEAGVDFRAVDNPAANKLTVHILAAVAEAERDAISERTKAALQAAKARGVILGANGRRLAERYRAEAAERVVPIAAELAALRAQGLTVRAIADALNARGVRSPGGAEWKPGNVHRALKRCREVA